MPGCRSAGIRPDLRLRRLRTVLAASGRRNRAQVARRSRHGGWQAGRARRSVASTHVKEVPCRSSSSAPVWPAAPPPPSCASRATTARSCSSGPRSTRPTSGRRCRRATCSATTRSTTPSCTRSTGTPSTTSTCGSASRRRRSTPTPTWCTRAPATSPTSGCCWPPGPSRDGWRSPRTAACRRPTCAPSRTATGSRRPSRRAAGSRSSAPAGSGSRPPRPPAPPGAT